MFVNCPFDDDYLPCFEALLFSITICGYRVRCALEENDGGDIRFDKLQRLIADSDHTIHDLSRTQVNALGLPRFNMPFELGLMMGAKHFGAGRQRTKRACILVARDHTLPRYLSDLAGNDPAVHHDDPRKVIRIVRDHLHAAPDGHAAARGGAHRRIVREIPRRPAVSRRPDAADGEPRRTPGWGIGISWTCCAASARRCRAWRRGWGEIRAERARRACKRGRASRSPPT